METVVEAAKDFQFFAENFVEIVDYKTDEFIKFKFNEGQKLLNATVDSLESQKDEAGKQRAWVLAAKARQAGFTTYTNAKMLHHAIFHPNAFVIIMSHKERASKDNLRRIKSMFKEMPWWFHEYYLEYSFGNTGSHLNNHSALSFDSLITNTEAEIYTVSSSADATRGLRPTAVHWTETAHCDDAYEVVKSIMPAMRKRNKSLAIIESTSNGYGNWYADKVIEALEENNDSDWTLVFNPWFNDEANADPVPDDFKRTEEEDDLVEKFGVDDRQLQWRRAQISNFAGEGKSFFQEYPSTVEESFQSADFQFFDNEVFDVITESNDKVPDRVRVTGSEMIPDDNGDGFLWQPPENHKEYVIGVDCAEGVGGDYTVIVIFDPTGELVFMWRSNKTKADEVTMILAKLGNWYNDALISVERENVGYYVINFLHSGYNYPKVYADVTSDNRHGIKISSRKKAMCTNLQTMVKDRSLKPRGSDALGEFRSFMVSQSTGKIGARKDCHDDIIMAMVMAAEAMTTTPPGFVTPSDNALAGRRLKRAKKVVMR